MSFPLNAMGALSWLAALNLGAAVAYGALEAARRWGGPETSARAELRGHYLALVALAAACALQPWLRSGSEIEPWAQAWSARSAHEYVASQAARQPPRESFSFGRGERAIAVDAQHASWAGAAVLLLAAIAALGSLGRDLRRLRRIKARAALVRRIGRVRVFVSPDARDAFSHRSWRTADVVLPSELAGADGAILRAAILHELQHHRQNDTIFVYAVWALRAACAFNPPARAWARRISETQEFACDEALIGRKKVAPRAYAICLFEAARIASTSEDEPVCATGLAFRRKRKTLSRRIERMLSQSNGAARLPFPRAGAFLAIVLIATTAFASRQLAQDRRVTAVEAAKLADVALKTSRSGFPIVVNELVVAELNRLVGTPEGREKMRGALARMEEQRPLVERKLAEYGVPEEFMAVPIVESWYRNLPERAVAPPHGAGMWMFIKSTAKIFGLRVDESTDERLDVGLETDAAMRLLSSDRLRFRDWQLALLAYNVGEHAVQGAIERTGSRDAWTLVRSGLETDRGYLPSVMAAILAMRNPEIVR